MLKKWYNWLYFLHTTFGGTRVCEDDIFVQYLARNIEDIQVGDQVYSYNTLTGETELAKVTATFALRSRNLNYLTIIDATGKEQVIESTDAHPFWVVTDNPDLSRAARSVVDENGVWLYHKNIGPTENGYWVEAKDLKVGDVFLGANGELSTLTNIVRIEQEGGIAVFNFTVEGNHNYFILAKEYGYGQTCILVHNAGPNCGATKTLHGGNLHDAAINAEIEKIKALGKGKYENIRKNQRQVDVNGKAVSQNRPDIQYDAILPDGSKVHVCIEFDNVRSASNNHFNTLTGLDPKAVVITHLL